MPIPRLRILRRAAWLVCQPIVGAPFDERLVRRILLVKTGGLPVTLAALTRLQQGYPEAGIDILTEEREFEDLLSDDRVSRVLYYRHISGFPSMWVATLREHYDVKAVLYNGEPSYGKIKVLAALLPAGKMRAYNQYGDSLYVGFREPEAAWIFIRGAIPGFTASTTLAVGSLGHVLFRLGSILTWPFVLGYLLTRAAIILVRRRRRLRALARLTDPRIGGAWSRG